MTGDVERAALIALLALPELGPVRLRALLQRYQAATDAWAAVQAGRLEGVPLPIRAETRDKLAGRWAAAAGLIDPARLLESHLADGIEVLVPADDAWPRSLLEDPDPPAVLFVRGDVSLLDSCSVAVVGTRRCTANGAAVAAELGRGLAAAGLPVVSGLAIGVDGVAHRAALDVGGRPVGVVATGLDRVYPGRHRALWEQVGAEGALVTEAALGVGPERWRFPCRNRLIAAFATAVVVVESGERGGSMSTADAALERGVPVLAVPGPVHAPQSAGTNRLLFDGAGVVRGVEDVLVVLGVDARRSGARGGPLPLPLDPSSSRVASVLSPAPTSLDRIVAATGLGPTAVVTALARLEAIGTVRRSGDGYELVPPR